VVEAGEMPFPFKHHILIPDHLLPSLPDHQLVIGLPRDQSYQDLFKKDTLPQRGIKEPSGKRFSTPVTVKDALQASHWQTRPYQRS